MSVIVTGGSGAMGFHLELLTCTKGDLISFSNTS